jgi:hypothetical protein
MDTNIFQDYAKKKVTNYLDTNYIRPLQKNIQGIKSNIRTDVQNTLNPGLSVGMQGAAFRAASPTTTPTSQVNVKSTPKSAAPVARAKVKSTKSPEQKYQEDLSRQISDSYKAQINFLTQQEQAAQAGLPGQLESIGQQYEAFLPELQSQLTQQQQAGATQQESLRMQEQQALAAGRRGAEEASQRAVQQFGGVGGSSAGQAASEIIGREQLKQAGSVQQQRVAGIENVNTQLRAIQSEYNSNVNKLQLEKQKSLENVRSQFNQTIKEIQSAKMQAGVTKASQTMNALQDFATRRRTIEDQSNALQNALTKAREDASLSLQSYNLKQQLQVGSPISYSGFTNPAERGKVISTVVAQSGGDPRILTQYGLTRVPGVGGGEDLFVSDDDGSVYNLSGVKYQ